MNTVTIEVKLYDPINGEWIVACTVETATGIRSGTETVSGGEYMTDEQLKGAILDKYL